MAKIIDLNQRFTEHFVLSEFLRSEKAEQLGIPNIPLKCHITALENLCVQCLEPTRQHIGMPIWVSSGYRCAKLNELVGGAATSQHLRGEAADITVLSKHWPFWCTTQEQIARMLFNWMKDCLPTYDQLILEHRACTWWVHVSCRIDLRHNRRQFFSLNAS